MQSLRGSPTNLPRRRGRLQRRIAIALLSLLVAVGLVLDRLNPIELGRLQSHSVMVLAGDGSILRAFTAAGGAWRFPAKTDEVDPEFLKFLIGYEDQRFYHHP